MKLSLIISSYNQKKRLFYSLQSAINQKLSEENEYEVILADDNSTDDTLEMVKKNFPNVIISLNSESEKNKYTLASNQNCAAKIATGDRLIFTNGDIIFSSNFVEEHANKKLQGNVIFGPCERSGEEIAKYLEYLLIKVKNTIIEQKYFNNYKEIIRFLSEKKLITKDPHHDGSVYTFNKEFSVIHPWGGNFSVDKNHFDSVGGFDGRQYYGGEERFLVKNIVDKFNCNVLSNKNAYSLHLWHPQINNENNKIRKEYNF